MSERWRLIVPLVAVAVLVACGNSSRHEEERNAPADLRTLTASRDFSGEKSVDADVHFAAGSLNVSPAAPGTVYRAVLNYDRNQMQPEVTYADGTLHVGLQGEHNVRLHGKARNKLDLKLGPDAPLNLKVEFGAGETRMDLGGLKLETVRLATGAAKGVIDFSRPNLGSCSLLEMQVGAARVDVNGLGNLSPGSIDLQGGVGDVNLDFSGAWSNDVSARVKMGFGSLRLSIPRDVGVQVRKKSMLASFEAADMEKHGDLWQSRGYEGTKRHLQLDIDAAFGAIRLGWIPAGAAARANADSSSF